LKGVTIQPTSIANLFIKFPHLNLVHVPNNKSIAQIMEVNFSIVLTIANNEPKMKAKIIMFNWFCLDNKSARTHKVGGCRGLNYLPA
jgi:hypothetical protein